MNPVTCAQCAEFIPNQFSFDPAAVGQCSAFIRYVKSLGRPIRNTEHDAATRALGNFDGSKLCRPNIERLCSKFKAIL